MAGRKRQAEKKIYYIVIIATAILLAILMAVPAVRKGLVGFFGWAVCVYIPALFTIGVLLFIGKKPGLSKKQTAVFSVLFILFVCTLHIMLAKPLFAGEGNYITAPLNGYDTAGGMLISLLTFPFKLLIKNYGVLLAVFFILTAVCGLTAIYPYILGIKDGAPRKKKPEEPKPENKLLITDIDKPYTPIPEEIPGPFEPKTPSERGALFTSIRSEEDIHLEKGQKSAEILFRNEPIAEKEEKPKYGILDKMAGGVKKETDFYTNQGRQRLFDENISKTFGVVENPEEEYKRRYGDMPVYDRAPVYKKEEAKPAPYAEQQERQERTTYYKEPEKNIYYREPEKPSVYRTPEPAYQPSFEEKEVTVIENPREYINKPLTAAEYAGDTLGVKQDKPAKEAVQQSLFGEAQNRPQKQRPYIAPPIDLLTNYPSGNSDFPENYSEVKSKIDEVMASAGVAAEVVSAKRGPTFTRYELTLESGIPVQKVIAQHKILMMRLCAKSIRILAPIKGKDAIGIEIPNAKRDLVGLRSVIASREFNVPTSGIQVAFGKNLEGQPFVADLSKMPHLLVAGATGTGKSVFINCLITSILFKYSPEDVRLILIDPKRVELSVYQNLPNLLIKETVKEPQHAVNLLRWLTQEMDSRFAFLEKIGCNELELYNESFRDKTKDPKIPRIVLVIDEMADLMIKGKGQVEEYIVRIAQLGRACGIHLVLATQRPTVNVITGLIRANILARVAFTVKTNQDSRIILDEGGAENLLGNGDMLFSYRSEMDRMQGAYVEIKDIKAICDFIRAHNDAAFNEEVANLIKAEPKEEFVEDKSAAAERDSDFESVLKKVLKTFILERRASVSSAQAKHNVGYIKAKKIVDALADRGYISTEEGAKPREVLITLDEFYKQFGKDE